MAYGFRWKFGIRIKRHNATKENQKPLINTFSLPIRFHFFLLPSMTVLRSREIVPPKTLASSVPTPPSSCPNPNPHPSRSGYYAVSPAGPPCRRSLRLASKSDPGKLPLSRSPQGLNSPTRALFVQNSTDSDGDAAIGNESGENDNLKVDSDVRMIDEQGKQFLSLRSGKRVVKGRVGNVISPDEEGECKRHLSFGGEEDEVIEIELEGFCPNVHGDGGGSKRKRVFSGEDEVIEIEMEGLSSGGHSDGGGANQRRRFSREEKAKGKLVVNDLTSKGVDVLHLDLSKSVGDVMHDGSCQEKLKEDSNADRKRAVNVSRSREEKGKGKLEEGADTKGSFEVSHDIHMDLRAELKLIKEAEKRLIAEAKESRSREYKERFRAVARENASRFAHFNAQEEENHLPAGASGESALNEMEPEAAVEDWPGPFSTAMKIIRDRAKKMNTQMLKSSSHKTKQPSLIWVPKNSTGCEQKLVPPSLKELCLRVLADNADAIASLENIPDPLRHMLSHKLCGSRKMNGDIFSLFLRGSPYEVCVRDCSWLTEEQFTKSYEECDTSNLTVLQLDQCGRCMPDYILHSTIAQSPHSLPALTTLSLSGACRLSDTGLSALVSSAPALRSINLNQCSLLTSAGIKILADKLGPVLHELYINDCQSIDAMLILPSLKRLEHLKVLSLASIETVCDDFVKELVSTLGHNMRELVLTNCTKLTDSSMKVIAENCPGLCTLDLVDLCKLTDSTMGYLANGCRAIHTLKLRRNKFSDEAIAAFVESSGELLKELSLNCVKEVGQNTAFALSRRSRNLFSLDVSWCRNLTDEAMGLIVDGCSSLKLLKLFGCTQITDVFVEGHSNAEVEIVGLKMSPFLKEIKLPCREQGQRYNTLVSSSI